MIHARRKKDDVISIARTAYDAYVRKDRAVIEELIAEDFHFTVRSITVSIAQLTLSTAGRIARRLRDSLKHLLLL